MEILIWVVVAVSFLIPLLSFIRPSGYFRDEDRGSEQSEPDDRDPDSS